MDGELIAGILEAYKNGQIDQKEALSQIKHWPFEELGFAKIDHHRALRQGFPEVIYCEGKTPEQVASIMLHLKAHAKQVMGTRASQEKYEAVKKVIPTAVYYKMARMILLTPPVVDETLEEIVVLSAGTSDMPVAEEAVLTAEAMGNPVRRVYDVGVAGLHRLLAQLPIMEKAGVLVVVAGMEGALASVVGGLVAKPVIAVPTSVGYGTSFQGITALLSMLNSCAAGVAVVNIDNGFGAGRMASLINQKGRDVK